MKPTLTKAAFSEPAPQTVRPALPEGATHEWFNSAGNFLGYVKLTHVYLVWQPGFDQWVFLAGSVEYIRGVLVKRPDYLLDARTPEAVEPIKFGPSDAPKWECVGVRQSPLTLRCKVSGATDSIELSVLRSGNVTVTPRDECSTILDRNNLIVLRDWLNECLA